MDTKNRIAAFIERWQGVTASELSTAQSFVIDLCALLGVDAPHVTPQQHDMFERPVTKPTRQPWPADLPEQVRAVAELLAASVAPLDEGALAARFSGRGLWKKRLPQILRTLEALGRARPEGSSWRAA